MPRTVAPLTDARIRTAPTPTKAAKLADGGGLFLLLRPDGGRYWRLKYRLDDRERELSVGSYPDVTLAEARKRRDRARELGATGQRPRRREPRRQGGPRGGER